MVTADSVGRTALRKASWHLLPLLFFGYGIAYMDRLNISFAALQMNEDLHFSATVYGLGGGLFFLSYAFFEVPSNLLLVRFGARRWIARIMLTWGLLAASMMFVKTPAQFYTMRFLLGMAEAGFFPGVLYYLMQWFPAEYRGRAISRFYFAFPLSSVLMGAVAGPLLGLGGHFGLAGWQWLFLVEGFPAIVLAAVILTVLPNTPAQAPWLTDQEREWIENRIGAEQASSSAADESGWLRAFLDWRVVSLGICNICIFGASYAFNLSAPTVLKGVTHWTATQIGLLMSGTALLGALAMLFNGFHSDRHRERYLHTAIPLCFVACATVCIGLSETTWGIVPAYIVSTVFYAGAQAAFWLIPCDSLRGKTAAVGLAAVGSIGMLGAFIGPYAWGLARDLTGSYKVGLLSTAVSYFSAAALLLLIRHRARRSQPTTSMSAAVAD